MNAFDYEIYAMAFESSHNELSDYEFKGAVF
jgi:hypothetical protein